MRRHAKHPGRSLFFLFMLSTYGAIFMAAPMVSALESTSPQRQSASAGASKQAASAGASGASAPADPAARRITVERAARPTFDLADRNQDGTLDKSEAGIVPGLSAIFERVDTNKDGKLDREEFERALENPALSK